MFVLWLALFPFVCLYSVYEGSKIWWLWGGGAVLAVWWIVRVIRQPHLTVEREDTLFLLWILVLTGASVVGIHPVDSLIGGSYRHQGVLFFITLFLILQTIRTLSFKNRTVLLQLLGAGVILESAVVLVQKLQGQSRVLGTFGEPNAVAGYLVVGAYFFLREEIKGWVKYVGFALTAGAILLTDSRTGIVAAVLLSAVWIWRFIKNRTVVYVLVGALFAAAIVYVGMLSGSRVASAYESRPLFWKLGWQEFVRRPILGYGAETGEVIYNQAFLRTNTRLIDFMVDRSHNVFLDIALWSGIIGLFVFCVWLISAFISKPYARILGFSAWLIFAFFQPLGVVHWLQLVLIISL